MVTFVDIVQASAAKCLPTKLSGLLHAVVNSYFVSELLELPV